MNDDTLTPARRTYCSPLLPIGIGLAIVVIYASSLHHPFLFDDQAFLDNPRLWNLSPLSTVLGDTTRPVLKLSLALNYAWSADHPWSYRAVNIAIHILAAWMLFGIIRRTLTLPWCTLSERSAAWIACSIAGLWAVHPLHTESVTFIVQRAESLMGLLFLATLYAFIRGSMDHNKAWFVLSVTCCMLGMATKEVMITCPVAVFLYDQAFLGGRFRAALRQRWAVHGCLALTSLIIVGLWQWNIIPRNQPTAGFALADVSPTEYALTQPRVILHYLKLVLWPFPLCIAYDWPVARGPLEILPALGLLTMALGAAAWLWLKRPKVGFLAVAFFLILAPTSSIMPINILASDHRMYLSLAAALTLAVMAVVRVCRHLSHPNRPVAIVITGAAAALSLNTLHHNTIYSSPLELWTHVDRHYPDSVRGQINLGNALTDLRRLEEAVVHYERALALAPQNHHAHFTLGYALCLSGQRDRALALCKRAIELGPMEYLAHDALGQVHHERGEYADAAASFEHVVALRPQFLSAYNNLAATRAVQGDFDAAKRLLEHAIDLNPHYPEATLNLATLEADHGQERYAIARLVEFLKSRPQCDAAHHNISVIFRRLGEAKRARSHARAAVRLAPRSLENLLEMANVEFDDGQQAAALDLYRRAASLHPKSSEAHYGLGNALRVDGALETAVSHCVTAVELNPENDLAHNALGRAYQDAGDLDAAMASFERAHALAPQNTDVINNLGTVLMAQGQAAAAEQRFEAALTLRPDQIPALENLVSARMVQHKTEEALVPLRRALALGSLKANLASQLAVTFMRQGDLQQAEEVGRTAVSLDRDHPESWSNLAVILATAGKEDASLRAFERALTIYRNATPAQPMATAECLTNTALQFRNAGRPTAAERHFREAIALFESIEDAALPCARCRALLAEMLIDSHHCVVAEPIVQSAIETLRDVKASDPILGRALLALARCRMARSDPESIALLQDALSIFQAASEGPWIAKTQIALREAALNAQSAPTEPAG
jgi:tetratricopeptide (TPR) repeat protein